MRAVASVTAVAVLLGGCATASRDLATTYVSPLQYQSLDCDQLGAESARVAARAQQLGARLDQAAENDKAIAGVGAILFWPALFALGGTKAQEGEFSQLKGQADAIQQAAIARKCSGAIALPSATAPATATPISAPAPKQ